MHQPVAGRNPGLDLIRGLAAAGIAAYHYLAWNHSITLHSVGTFGVYVFFVLSAVTMMIRYENDFRGAIRAETLVAFYRNRVARLVPLLALVSVLSAYWAMTHGDSFTNQAARTLLTATGAMGLHLPGFLSNATGAWSLGIEAVFYVAFPIVALLVAQANARQVALSLVVLVAFQQAALFAISDLPDAQFWHYYITPVTFAPFFALGILIFKAPIKQRDANIWLSLAALAVLAGYTQAFPVVLWRSPIHYLIMTAVAAAAVAFAYRGAVPSYMARVATFLGDISYALYLTHWFAHRIASSLVYDYGAPAFLMPVIFLIVAPLLAWLCFRFFERPARDFLRSKLSRGQILPAR